MTPSNDLERRLAALLDAKAAARAPEGLLKGTLARVPSTRPRPAWRIAERWSSTPIALRLVVLPRAAALPMILIAAFVLAIAAGLLTMGGRIPVMPAVAVPEPAGLARNGLIAYGHEGDIWVMTPDGSGQRALVTGPDLVWPAGWSPDGTKLAYWSMTFDGAWDDDAAVQAADTVPDNMAATVVNADGSDPRPLLSGIKWPSDCGTDITWAPDSRRLAVAHRIENEGHIYHAIDIVSLDGSGPTRVVTGGVDPSWSPDGTSFAFHGGYDSVGESSALGVVVIGVDGSNPRQVSQQHGSSCAFDGAAWSPDSRLIAYDGGTYPYSDVWVAKADGSGQVNVSGTDADEHSPRWSPDGTRLAFARAVPPRDDVGFVIADPDGGNQVVLDSRPLWSTSLRIGGQQRDGSMRLPFPTWSPDGRFLAGIKISDDYMDAVGVTIVDVSGRTPPLEIPTGKGVIDLFWQRLAP